MHFDIYCSGFMKGFSINKKIFVKIFLGFSAIAILRIINNHADKV